MVAAPDEPITLRFESPNEELLLTVDGQFGEALQPGDEVRVERSSRKTRLIRLHERTFYDILRTRLIGHFEGAESAAGRANEL